MQLQKDVVKKETYELLKNLMNEDMLSDFFLVGGTALALKLGHRISIDLDMFTQNDIPVAALQKKLAEKYGFSEEFRAGNTLKGDFVPKLALLSTASVRSIFLIYLLQGFALFCSGIHAYAKSAEN